jgi:hypothetical protein
MEIPEQHVQQRIRNLSGLTFITIAQHRDRRASTAKCRYMRDDHVVSRPTPSMTEVGTKRWIRFTADP